MLTLAFRFFYPRKALLTSGDDAKVRSCRLGDVPMNFIQPGGASVATVALPDTRISRHRLLLAFFRVNVNRNVSEQECEHFAFVDTRNGRRRTAWTPRRPRSARLKWRPLRVFSASAIKQVETQYYHNYENGACYEYSWPRHGRICHRGRH